MCLLIVEETHSYVVQMLQRSLSTEHCITMMGLPFRFPKILPRFPFTDCSPLFSIIAHTSGAVVIRQARWLAPNPGKECHSLNLDEFSSAVDIPRGVTVTAEGWRQKKTRHMPCQHRMYPKKWEKPSRPKESMLPLCFLYGKHYCGSY